MHPLEEYLHELHDIRATGGGVKETSYYPALANLLNAVGHTLKPRVRCIIHLQNVGAGIPDGGLFTPDQLQRGNDTPLQGQKPSRGAIECKPTNDDAFVTAESDQVTDYWKQYQQVLVTNYRDFVLVGHDEAGKAVKLESFRLAATERGFWLAAGHPKKTTTELGDRFIDYLKRVLLHPAPLADPKDLAWFLASYARDAKARMAAAALPALASIRQAMEEALGVKFEGDKGDHFFRSSLVQTLFYGVFSAWVLWHRSHSHKSHRFDWERSAHYLHVPVLRKLFHELAEPGKLEEWKLDELLNWTGAALNRVDRDAFFAKFEDAEAVQYFYEPFLEAFDPVLRKQLGVWYTPREIVRYMVARVDTVLREDLGRPDGLADPGVFILDPCCGTGAFLAEVLRTIATTVKEKGAGALLGAKLKEAATHRLFGFEILPAPFVVAHLQLGLFLQSEGVPLEAKERAGVFLTNALTGWEPPKGPKQKYLFPEMEEEHEKAQEVKQQKPILVVLGNPPYSGFAGISKMEEERDLSEGYRWKAGDPADLKPQGQGLNDLYVRFFRIAERCIVERHDRHGVVCFISNYSWLDGLSFPLMRQRYLNEFDSIWIDCLNGDKYKTGKLTPEGKPDPSIFSTEQNREGIQVGTAIALMVREVKHAGPAIVRFRDLWGQSKREDLFASLPRMGPKLYKRLAPERPIGLPFRPLETAGGYLSWPSLPLLFPQSYPGVKTGRDDVLVDVDRENLVARMETYFDSNVSHEELRELAAGLIEDGNRFQAIPAREHLLKRGFLRANVVRYLYRPFDVRWIYWEPKTKLVHEKSPEFFENVFAGNAFLFTTGRTRKDRVEPPIVTSLLTDLNCLD